MEVLKKIAADDPVLGCVSADAIEIAHPRPMVARVAAGILEPTIFDAAIVDPDSIRDVGRVGLYELRPGIEKPYTINQRRLGARIENDFIVPSVADCQVSNGSIRPVRPNTKRNVAIVRVIHAFAGEYDIGAPGSVANRDIVAAIHVEAAA